MLAAGELLVARVNYRLFAATAMVQHGLIDIPAGNADLFAMLHVGDGAAAYGLFYGLFNVVTIPPQKTLTVYRALVLAIEASVDHIAHRPLRGASKGKPQAARANRQAGERFLAA